MLADLFEGADPLAPLPIIVPTRGMDRWLRRALAHANGAVAGVECVGLDDALDAASAAAASAPGTSPDQWWRAPAAQPWSRPALVGRVIEAWRAAWHEPALDALRAYVDPQALGPDAPLSWRLVHLAHQLVDVYLSASRTRPAEVVAWATGAQPALGAPPWFARTLAALGVANAGPAWARACVLDPAAPAPQLSGPPVKMWGVSALSDIDRALLARFAAHHPVEWYRPTLCPTRWSRKAPKALPENAVAFMVAEEAERLAARAGALGAVSLTHTPCPRGSPSPALALWQATLRGESPPSPALAGPLPQLQACWSPLREVETLRDALLERFDAESLEPRDVLVLTPDISTYGPLIQSVFARPGAQAPPIPVVLTRLGLSQTNPLADVLLRVLALCEDRFTAPALLALLSLEPAQRAAGLDPDDIADLEVLLLESGARWGLEANDKWPIYGCAVHENTLEFGLERMAIGVVMPDELDSPDAAMATGAPERARRVARLMAVVERFRVLRTELRARTLDASGWRALLLGALDALAQVPPTQQWLTQELRETLDEALPSADGTLVSSEAVTQLLRARFELPVHARGSAQSAVTVQPLSPQSVTPHPFIALVGMNTGSFPRVERSLAWAPGEAPDTPARHAPEALDRLALAQAILWAGDDVFVSWTAHEPRRGQPLPPCVPVDELIDALVAAGADRPTLVTRGARHPWSPVRPGPFFDAHIVTASQAVIEPRVPEVEPLKAEQNPPTEVTLSQLADDLCNGAKLLLYRRLGIYLSGLPEPLPEREPIELDGLQSWALRNELLRAATALGALETGALDDDEREALVEATLAAHKAQGTLPLCSGAEFVIRKALDDVDGILEKAARLYDADTVHDDEVVKLQVELPCGVTVTGLEPPRAFDTDAGVCAHHWVAAGGAVSPKQLLRAWVFLLAAAAQGTGAVAARVTVIKTPNWLRVPDDPLDTLDALVRLWQLGRRRPLHLFPRSNHALAGALLRAEKPKKATSGDAPEVDPQTAAETAIKGAWTSTPDRPGDDADPYIRVVFDGWHPKGCLSDFGQTYTDIPAVDEVPTFNQLSQLVWLPLLRCRGTDREMLKRWQTGGDA